MSMQTDILAPGFVESQAAFIPKQRQVSPDLARLPILTPWTNPDPSEATEDEARRRGARDFLFRTRVSEVLAEQAPWLIPILLAAEANVLAMPGKVYVWVGIGQPVIEIPNLGAHLLLLPWTDSDEPAN